MGREPDDDGVTYPNGKPPNRRTVPTCATCKHSVFGYEGEINCKLYPVRYEWYDEEDESSPSDTQQYTICDAHEEEPRDG